MLQALGIYVIAKVHPLIHHGFRIRSESELQFSDSYVQNPTENQKCPRKIGTAIPILDRFRSDSDALVLEHQIRLISNSETIMAP